MGVAFQRLAHKIRQDHPVTARLPRSHGIEQPCDDDRQPLFLPVGEGQKFVQRLRRRITPAAFGRRPEHQIGIFMERKIGAFPVHFRSGCGKDQLALSAGGLEHQLRAVDVGLDGSHRAFDNQLDAHRGRQMKNDVGLVHQFRQQLAVFQRLKEIVHPVIFLKVPDVFHAAGRKIVHQQDFVAALQQTLGKMRAHKTCAASNQINQVESSLRPSPGPIAILNFSARRALRDFLLSSSRPYPPYEYG